MNNISIFLKDLAVLLGTVIGVGIFGLPFASSVAGFPVAMIYLVLLGTAVTYLHLLYGRVVTGTDTMHRFPGYARKYLGVFWERIVIVLDIIGLGGAIIAYLIVGGLFLYYLLNPILNGSIFLYTFIFFTVGAIMVLRGIANIAFFELVLVLLLFVVLGILFLQGSPHINYDHFKIFNQEKIFFPYGIILFSLWGLPIIPEVTEMVLKRKLTSQNVFNPVRNVLVAGGVITVMVSAIFIFTVQGVTGEYTSKEALSAFAQTVGGLIGLGFIFGIICCFTSFITIALTLKKVLLYDVGLSKKLAWLLALFTPFIIYLAGVQVFLPIVSLIGSVFLGIEGILLVFIYRSFMDSKMRLVSSWPSSVVVFVLAAGISLEIFYALSA